MEVLRWGDGPGLSGWAHGNHKGLLKGQRAAGEPERRGRLMDTVRGRVL